MAHRVRRGRDHYNYRDGFAPDFDQASVEVIDAAYEGINRLEERRNDPFEAQIPSNVYRRNGDRIEIRDPRTLNRNRNRYNPRSRNDNRQYNPRSRNDNRQYNPRNRNDNRNNYQRQAYRQTDNYNQRQAPRQDNPNNEQPATRNQTPIQIVISELHADLQPLAREAVKYAAQIVQDKKVESKRDTLFDKAEKSVLGCIGGMQVRDEVKDDIADLLVLNRLAFKELRKQTAELARARLMNNKPNFVESLLNLKDQSNGSAAFDLYQCIVRKHNISDEEAKELFGIDDPDSLKPHVSAANPNALNYSIQAATNQPITLDMLESARRFYTKLYGGNMQAGPSTAPSEPIVDPIDGPIDDAIEERGTNNEASDSNLINFQSQESARLSVVLLSDNEGHDTSNTNNTTVVEGGADILSDDVVGHENRRRKSDEDNYITPSSSNVTTTNTSTRTRAAHKKQKDLADLIKRVATEGANISELYHLVKESDVTQYRCLICAEDVGNNRIEMNNHFRLKHKDTYSHDFL